MCGFLVCKGFEPALARTAAATFSFRGPDHTGASEVDGFVCVHHRLAIIGLGPQNDQPFRQGGDVLLYNGEIFNYEQIKKQYLGDAAITNSGDVEVFYHLARHEDLLGKVHGFFAYALLSGGVLRFGRDLFGQKPLYYFFDGARIAVGSDIRAFEVLLKGELTLSRQAVDDIFDFNHCVGETTIYEQVRALLPGQTGKFEHGRLSFSRRAIAGIWDGGAGDTGRDRDALARSITEVTTADVPCAIALSAGFDSQVIEQNSSAMRCAVTIDYSRVAESRMFKLERDYPHIVEPFKPVDTRSQVGRMLEIFGQPFGNVTAIYLDIVCRTVREKGFKLLVTGELGDELLLGYPRHKLAYRLDWLHPVMPLRLLPLSWRQALVDRVRGPRRKKALMYFLAPRELRDAVGYQQHYELARLRPFRSPMDAGSRYQQLVYGDLERFVPDNLFVISDCVGMRNGIEVRTPFADKRLFGVVNRLSLADMTRLIRDKGFAAKLFALRYKPTSARRKIGFNPPYQDVLDGSVDVEAEIMELAGRLPYAAARARNALANLRRDPASYTQGVFGLLVLAAFLRQRPGLAV